MIEQLYVLRDKLLSQAQVLDGVDEQAREQNKKLIRALKSAGHIINEKYPNDVFGLLLKGSRIKGYHGINSDADLIIVSPAGAGNKENIDDILAESKKKFGVEDVLICPGAQLWDSKIDLEDFLYQCDNEPDFINSITGYELNSNPNLLIARVIALRVVSRWNGEFDWNFVRDTYAIDYLGEQEDMNQKVSKRFCVSPQDVNRILNQSMWNERYRKFALEDWKELLAKYELEFKRLRNRGKFVMSNVYRTVMEDFKAGF